MLDLEIGEPGSETQFMDGGLGGARREAGGVAGAGASGPIRAYLPEANVESSSAVAPDTTFLPQVEINAVVLGRRMRQLIHLSQGLSSPFQWRCRRNINSISGGAIRYLWVVLRVSAVERDGFVIRTTIPLRYFFQSVKPSCS